ncbi:MAG: TetR/AcrR family transcriptional regulator [Actinomyces sp.]|nr:TetR/AcrR family transcriptional regulator [Actinomyces sp.]
MVNAAMKRFQALAPEKRERIERAAIAEFAAHGYATANTNTIAERAGISVGALFRYFDTKRDIFMYVVGRAQDELRTALLAITDEGDSALTRIGALAELAVTSASTHRDLVRLYCELTATGSAEIVAESVDQLEGETFRMYRELIAEGQETGEIRTDIDSSTLAFFIDNIMMSLQYARASDYHVQRALLYVPGMSDAELASGAREFLISALQVPEGGNHK